MYSQEEKLKAIKLYIQYDKQLIKTVRNLGYPSPNALRKCHNDFNSGNKFKQNYNRKPKYSDAQKEKAIKYYFNMELIYLIR